MAKTILTSFVDGPDVKIMHLLLLITLANFTLSIQMPGLRFRDAPQTFEYQKDTLSRIIDVRKHFPSEKYLLSRYKENQIICVKQKVKNSTNQQQMVAS